LLKNRKLQTICKTIGGIVIARVIRYTLPTILPAFDGKSDLGSSKNGLILIQATILWTTHEQYSSIAVEERYHPYPGKDMKQKVPCIMARRS
jgi:hypothetical protein